MPGGLRAIVSVVTMVSGKTNTGATTSYIRNEADYKTFQLSGRTTNGAGSATVHIEGTLDEPTTDATVHWDTVGTFAALTLSTTDTSSSFTSTDRFRAYRVYVDAIGGTGASIDVKLGM